MSEDTKRNIWQSPWGYAESVAIVAGVVLISLTLQLVIGPFDFFLLTNPVNIITGLVILLVSALLSIFAPKSNFVRWISGVPMSVSLIGALLFLSLIMGLTPQVAEGVEPNLRLGFDSMTRAWSMVLIYMLTLFSLGVLIFRRLRDLKIANLASMLNHIGLYLVLFAAGLGYADMERYVMYVSEGETQWRVYDAQNSVKELPIAIKLNDFDMDHYPPKLVVIDRSTGEVQPVDDPQYFQIDPDVLTYDLHGYRIEVVEYIHEAVRSSDSTYREVPMPGATPAVDVVVSSQGDTIAQGWVSAGSIAQAYMTLPLSDTYSVVMTQAEPRKFVSQVEVYTEDGENIEAEIVVNSPLKVGNWMIYQYGCDDAMGALSTYSSFELVYDPWLEPIYFGVVMMMLGAVLMIIRGRRGN
ncbi:MAG: cytochrome c biogenesis protein ResB [Rikenellaceae bacterium]